MPSPDTRHVVTIIVEQSTTTALWFVTSPGVRGLLIAEHTFDAAIQQVPGAIRDLAEAGDLASIAANI